MSQMMVFSGAERRRRWSVAEKQALVTRAFAPGAVVAEVARGADLQAGQIYRWRQDLRVRSGAVGPPFAEVVLHPSQRSEPSDAGAIIVELVGGVRVRISASAPAPLVATTLRALSK